MDSDAPSLTAVLGAFAFNAGLAWMTGCVAMMAWVRGRAGAWPHATGKRLSSAVLAAGVWTLLALAFDLWRRSAEAAGVPLVAAGPATKTMLTATHYGHAWMAGMAAVVAIVATATAFARTGGLLGHGTRAMSVRIIGLGVLVYTRSTVSHAGSGGDLSFAVGVDGIHLLVVSLWAGVVWVSAFVIHPWSDEDGFADAMSWLRALSIIATIALTTIVLTGLVNSWRASAGSLAALLDSTYGLTLAAKVALVVCAAALGGVNRWIFLPRLPARAARRAFKTVLRIEAAVLAGVLMLAAVLSNLEPPGSM